MFKHEKRIHSLENQVAELAKGKRGKFEEEVLWFSVPPRSSAPGGTAPVDYEVPVTTVLYLLLEHLQLEIPPKETSQFRLKVKSTKRA